MLMIFGVQIALPAVLLAWQAHGRDTNIVYWALKHTAAWSYIYATTVAGLWLAAPWYAPHALMVVSISLAARTLPGAFRLWRQPRRGNEWVVLAARTGAAAVGVAALGVALQGRALPAANAIIELEFPLRSGRYYIANGGATTLVNEHVRMLSSERLRRFRGASYGVDIVALNAFGFRASRPAPEELEEYAIFGDAIYPPCEGVVVRVEDWLPDLVPPAVDRAHVAGNFVMLECGPEDDVQVLLAHMRSNSVKVHPGDYVTLDTKLGEVGNSGNSGEPHLHIHAQRPGEIWQLFTAEPLPIRFDGRYLVRNDRITSMHDRDDIIDD